MLGVDGGERGGVRRGEAGSGPLVRGLRRVVGDHRRRDEPRVGEQSHVRLWRERPAGYRARAIFFCGGARSTPRRPPAPREPARGQGRAGIGGRAERGDGRGSGLGGRELFALGDGGAHGLDLADLGVAADDAARLEEQAVGRRGNTRTVLSQLATARRLPLGEKATEETPEAGPEKAPSDLPSLASQRRAVASQLAVAMRAPSGEKITCAIRSSWPRRTATGLPSFASQILAVASAPAVTTRALSGEKATVVMRSMCPGSVARSLPSTFHRLALPSCPPVTIRLASGEMATAVTPPGWPWSVVWSLPSRTLQRRVVPSSLAVATKAPVGA